MPFSIRPYRQFLAHCAVTDNPGPFFQLLLASCSGFGLLITLLFLSCGTACAEWVSVESKVEEGLTQYTLYVEPDTIRRNGDVVELSALIDFTTTQTTPSPPHLSVRSRSEIHCAKERIRLLALTAFSGNMGSGEVVFSDPESNDQGISVEPGSVAESLWKVVCGKR